MDNLKKIVTMIEEKRMYLFGEKDDKEYVHVYELNEGALWHRYSAKVGGDMLLGDIRLDGKKYRFKMMPKKSFDKTQWNIMTNERGADSIFVPRSWASKYYSMIHGKIMIGEKLYEFLLVLNDALTLMNSYAAANGKFCGSTLKTPCFSIYLRNDNIKHRKGFEEELKEVEEA